MAPLDVSGYGTLEERLDAGDEIDAEERKLMARALAENSVIVAQMTPFFDEPAVAAKPAKPGKDALAPSGNRPKA
jgi:hypothetical protein